MPNDVGNEPGQEGEKVRGDVAGVDVSVRAFLGEPRQTLQNEGHVRAVESEPFPAFAREVSCQTGFTGDELA